MNWEKLESWSKNCGKLTIPAKATFKNPNFPSLYELRKNLDVLILNILMTWEMLCLNLNFTAENKIGNLHKAGHISTSTWGITYSISSNLKNLLELVKIRFPLGKCEILNPLEILHITQVFRP